MLSRRSLLAAAVPASLPPADRLALRLPGAVVLRAEWEGGVDTSIQPGSLWKPFLAASHVGPPPRYYCDGSHCWLGRKHGWLDLPGALANSCNQWFQQLYPTLVFPLALFPQWGLPVPPDDNWPEWPCTPRALANAYAELLARRADYPLVWAGLRLAAERGTARALGRGFLAKTGTGPSRRHAGDGWVAAAYPTDTPATFWLYRQRGVTGAQAAAALRRELP
ncbi:MAG TPA: hypothetical protein VFQ91_25695 [Bryobacteraceae bacterium]|nr:hypothetical protein [Bryobacteraceae bacterium]